MNATWQAVYALQPVGFQATFDVDFGRIEIAKKQIKENNFQIIEGTFFEGNERRNLKADPTGALPFWPLCDKVQLFCRKIK